MATVRELLDGLHGGKLTIDQVAAEFARRTWPKPRPATDAQRWGVADDDAPDDDSIRTLNADSRLSAEQYAKLAAAAAAKG